MMLCPNCENYMNVGTKCTVCGHKDRDPDCQCSYCKGRRNPPRNYDFELMFGHSPGMNMGEYEESTPNYVKELAEKKRKKKIQVAVIESMQEIVEEIMNPKEVLNITDGSAVCHGVKHAYEIKESKK